MQIALCLEDLGASSKSGRYVTCVAVLGRQPGLAVDDRGQIVWRAKDRIACGLWVSADDRLILWRPVGAPPVRVERAGRSIDAPCEKPVVLLNQDVFETSGRRLRVHIHGSTQNVSPPAPLVQRHAVGRLAATVAIGVAAFGCNKTDAGAATPVEVREAPPSVSIPPQVDDAGAVIVPAPADAGPLEAAPPPIEVRDDPPEISVPTK